MDRLQLIRAGAEAQHAAKQRRKWRLSPSAIPTSSELPQADISDIERVQREMAAMDKEEN